MLHSLTTLVGASLNLFMFWFLSVGTFTVLAWALARAGAVGWALRGIHGGRGGIMGCVSSRFDNAYMALSIALSFAVFDDRRMVAAFAAWVVFQRLYYTIMRSSALFINIVPRRFATTFGHSEMHHDFKELPMYVFAGGALGFLDGNGFKTKRVIQKHLKTLWKTTRLASSFQDYRAKYKCGEFGRIADAIAGEHDLQYVGSYWEALAVVSILWRLAPLSAHVVQLGMQVTAALGAHSKDFVVRFAAEMTILATTDVMLSQYDHVRLRGRRTFVTHSEDVVVVRDSRGHVFDVRHLDMFGCGKSLCPGRFFVTDLWLSQPRFADQGCETRTRRRLSTSAAA